MSPQQEGRPPQPLNAEQLDQLVAPIALYPDNLVAQVLTAATFPEQVVDADQWRQSQSYASPYQIAAGADRQTWDPSVKALTTFPQVLAQMHRNLPWTRIWATPITTNRRTYWRRYRLCASVPRLPETFKALHRWQ